MFVANEETIAMLPHSRKAMVFDLQAMRIFCVEFACVSLSLSRFSCFLLQSKNMHEANWKL